MDSNDLAIGSTSERMEPVSAVAPAQGEVAAQNQQSPPRQHSSPAEPAAKGAGTDPATDSGSDSGSDPEHSGDSDKEGPAHRVDSMA